MVFPIGLSAPKIRFESVSVIVTDVKVGVMAVLVSLGKIVGVEVCV